MWSWSPRVSSQCLAVCKPWDSGCETHIYQKLCARPLSYHQFLQPTLRCRDITMVWSFQAHISIGQGKIIMQGILKAYLGWWVEIRGWKLSIYPNTFDLISKLVAIVASWQGSKRESIYAVKPMYNDHPWDPKIVAVVDRWLLFRVP